jgi:hypothetical protein
MICIAQVADNSLSAGEAEARLVMLGAGALWLQVLCKRI